MTRILRRRVAGGLFSLILSGCSSHWEKPNGSSPLWDLDTCNIQAEARYPVKNEVVYSTSYDQLSTLSCTEEERKKDNKRCSSTRMLPTLRSGITDVNAATRMQLTEACMKGRGWRQVSRPLWR